MMFNGLKVLIIEDQLMLGMIIEEFFTGEGAEIVGIVPSLRKALQAVSKLSFDLCMLDLNLFGEMTFSVADILIERNIPFVISSGYNVNSEFLSAATSSKKYIDHTQLIKPYTLRELENAVKIELGKHKKAFA